MYTTENNRSSGPWWKYPHMWMVVGGPAVVVVASLTTFWIAAKGADMVYSGAPPTHRSSTTGARQLDHMPALEARNHAATQGKDAGPARSDKAEQPPVDF